MTPRASLCPAISRSSARRNRSSSPSLMLPSIAASRSAPPQRPCLTPPRKREGCPHEVGLDRPVHAVARAARSCWHSPDHLTLYLTERGSPTFGFCIRLRVICHLLYGIWYLLHGICHLVETVDALEQKRKIQPLRCFTFIGSRDLLRWMLESSFLEQGLHGVQHNSNLPAALGWVLLPPMDEFPHKRAPRAQIPRAPLFFALFGRPRLPR